MWHAPPTRLHSCWCRDGKACIRGDLCRGWLVWEGLASLTLGFPNRQMPS